MWMSSCINTILFRDYSFPMVQNSLTLGRWAYFWCLSSVPAVYMSSFILVPSAFDNPLLYFCNKFEIKREYESFNLFFFFRVLRLFKGPYYYRCTWELAFLFLKKKKNKQQEILLQITSLWVVLTLNNIVFQAMNMGYHTILFKPFTLFQQCFIVFNVKSLSPF